MQPMLLLAFLIRAVLLVLLVLQLLMRLALLDILLVLAPLAAALWILPQTQAWASLWGRLFVGTAFGQFVQMLALSLGLDLLTKLPTNGAAALLQPLLGIAVLAVGLKIPGLMGGALAGGNVVGRVVGMASSAAVGAGVAAGVRSFSGAAGGGSAAVARAATPPASASQYSVPLSVGVHAGRDSSQLNLPLAVAQSTNGEV